MKNSTNNISEVIAPMFAITMELDAIIGALLREKFNMSLADFKILRAIYMLGTCTQFDVARFNQVSEAAVSKRMRALSCEGLIKKTTSPDDKRKSILCLTTKGKTLMHKLQIVVIKNTESILNEFSLSKQKMTTELLIEMLEMIIKISPNKKMLMESKHPILKHLKGK